MINFYDKLSKEDKSETKLDKHFKNHYICVALFFSLSSQKRHRVATDFFNIMIGPET